MINNDMVLHFNKLFGKPVNGITPLPGILTSVVDTSKVLQPGEPCFVYDYNSIDDSGGTVLVIGTHKLNLVAISQKEPTLINLKAKKSPAFYVDFTSLLNSADVDVLGRKKFQMIDAFDSAEVMEVMDGVMQLSGDNLIDVDSGMDAYDIIVAGKRMVADVSDSFVAIVGNDVYESLEDVDKKLVATQNYALNPLKALAEQRITVMRCPDSTVKYGESGDESGTDVSIFGSTDVAVFGLRSGADKFPITMVRRLLHPDIIKSLTGLVEQVASERVFVTLSPSQDLENDLALQLICFIYGQSIFYINDARRIAVASSLDMNL